MHPQLSLLTLALSTLAHSSPLHHREVPQEHSHNAILASVRTSLNLNNPAKIQDPVFGLLGNAAAAAGQGSITNTDCLHQATADQAFTNAKATKDVTGMTNALIFAALERNTAKVGQASVKCTAIKAKNPEIAAISQHQDPASTNAATTNKASTLTLAKQIASIGGDPQAALKAGTFKPGDLADATGKGNTCDTADDTEGCIVSQNLLVPDATAAEIAAAAAGGASPAANGPAGTAAAAMATGTGSSPVGAAAAAAAGAPFANASTVTNGSCASPASSASPTSPASGNNVQTFTGALGGAPPPVTSTAASKRPFAVNGDTFVNAGAALQRSCAVQHNRCADAANGGGLEGGVGKCDAQEGECNGAAKGG